MADYNNIAMRPIATQYTRCSVVCLFVGLNTLSCAKTAELIEEPFGVGTRVGPGNHVLDGGADRPRERGILEGRFRAGGPLFVSE